MSAFDERWNQLTGRVRCRMRSAGELQGLNASQVDRVLSRVRGGVGVEVGMTEVWLLWRRVGLQGLGLAAAVLVASLWLEGTHLRRPNPFRPGVQDTVASLVWRIHAGRAGGVEGGQLESGR